MARRRRGPGRNAERREQEEAPGCRVCVDRGEENLPLGKEPAKRRQADVGEHHDRHDRGKKRVRLPEPGQVGDGLDRLAVLIAQGQQTGKEA